ncbi:MAG: HPr kinase/phosphorylase [Pikeienuella sp.]
MTAPGALHASAVAAAGRALLILGPSGAGKSALAMELIALGAGLIADDLVVLRPAGDGLVAAHPDPAATTALIEARGIGLIRLPAAGAAPLGLVIDLGSEEAERLPPRRFWRGAPLLLRSRPLRPAALLLALRAGGPEDPEAGLRSGLAPGGAGDQIVNGLAESAESG